MLECSYQESKQRLVIEVAGDLKSTTVDAARLWLEREWPARTTQPLKQVYLDLREARIIDSAGLNFIFLLVRASRRVHAPLTLQIGSPAALRVFEFAGLDQLATIKYRRRKQL